MGLAHNEETALVTGAAGHIGREVSRQLREANWRILAVDLCQDAEQNIQACDLRSKDEISQLFREYRFRTVIHLAGILPTAFQADPLTGADVNLGGSLELLRRSVATDVKRFIFASSMSVYGSHHAHRRV